MELRSLRYFVAVAQEKSFSRAATLLHISQPPLSRQIRKLEEELGAELFERNTRHVRLTSVGVSFYENARRTLDQADLAMQIARKTTKGEMGTIRIGHLAYADLTIIPKLLPRLVEAYPGVQFELQTLTGAIQLEALHNGSIDVAFVHLPVGGDDFAVERVLRHPYVLAVPSTHRFAKRASVPLSALAGERYVFFARRKDPSLYDSVIGFCRAAGVILNIAYETDHMQTTLGLVAAGLGVALLPSAITTVVRPGIAYVRIRPANAWYEMHVVTRRDERSAAVENMLRTLRTLDFSAP